jgi:hypothetical protein
MRWVRSAGDYDLAAAALALMSGIQQFALFIETIEE